LHTNNGMPADSGETGLLAGERLNLDFRLDAKYPRILRRIQYRPMMSAPIREYNRRRL